MASEPEVQVDGWWSHRGSDSHPLADGLQGIQMLEHSLSVVLFFLSF